MRAADILLVEDESIVALHLRQQLVKLGYQVVGVASSGPSALRLIEERQPALVLMDIRIEGDLDGIETAGLLPRSCATAVIYLTAHWIAPGRPGPMAT